ncbi:FAD/NAD(P)-binding domain-containing protein [Dendrothele bispora CBS 962.96]|uniref:FAD/NAD(P)-binding domain-containing protein n=1 Tax=Dendrothele bispora (strain CBS 962.96) TaxID=1314807 RepID=A0A4S8MFG6_DENBC|nr:FAD/NAD(P)-binding domain-containing protein [Dendrothele bispora CBS 962.96]
MAPSPTFPLPTLGHLGVKDAPPDDLDAIQIVKQWFKTFASSAEHGNVNVITALFLDECYWRDLLALTWDFRTFVGSVKLTQFLNDQLAASQLKAFKLRDDSVQLQKPFPDLAWIQFSFNFEVGNFGLASGIGRLVPQSDGGWKANCMLTNLEDLKNFSEKLGAFRNHEPNHGLWESQRRQEVAFEDAEPTVLVIGGSQNGLEVAARLKMLDVSTLIVEKLPRIGDNWRNRYSALCLHDPIYFAHMPYLPFPPNWPEYTPAAKLANWLEGYADFMELNYWTSTTVTKAEYNKESRTWSVRVVHTNGKERVFKKIKHVIFATGFAASNEPKIPVFPGVENYQGQTLHSSQYKTAEGYANKKIVVIGSSTSGHDIAADFCHHGNDTTMVQRGATYVMSAKNGWLVMGGGLYTEDGPPVEVADRIGASFPYRFLIGGMFQRQVEVMNELDKDLLTGLQKRGFKLSKGRFDAGPTPRVLEDLGGYYIDTGATKLIINGKIKLKNDSLIESFTSTGLKFKDGSELLADVVVFATGYGDFNNIIRKLCDQDVAKTCKPIWGLDEEGELRGCWRDLGVPGLWFMTGGLALSRFYSKRLALQIKAIEEGLLTSRYSLSP